MMKLIEIEIEIEIVIVIVIVIVITIACITHFGTFFWFVLDINVCIDVFKPPKITVDSANVLINITSY